MRPTEELLNVFGEVYDDLYKDSKEPLTIPQDALTAMGDNLLKMRDPVILKLAEERGDLFTSDREVAAMTAAWLYNLANDEVKGENK